ncbi:MAG: hypothetical protein MRERV_4c109 [Mycoplasmataceae bacterium RV_VA103A]|nr:MAG: hypothetical protein MRERV_4c109 [Mycoplasmataceae bacterium RV_VA103A]
MLKGNWGNVKCKTCGAEEYISEDIPGEREWYVLESETGEEFDMCIDCFGSYIKNVDEEGNFSI